MELAAHTQVELDGQYRELREGAGWFQRPRAVIAIEGADAAEFLQGQLTNDVEALAPGAGCYAAILDRKGHLRADMRVLRLDDESFRLDLEPETGADVLGALRMYSIGRDVEIADTGEQWATIAVMGPGAAEAVGCGPPGPEHSHRRTELGGVEVLTVATDTGLDLIARPVDVAALRDHLAAAGAAEVSADAAEIVRVESGRPRFGREMAAATMPAEAGIVARAVSFDKGCYIGQETVARLHYRGRPNRMLHGLRLGAPAASGDAVLLGEREVGTIGTAVLSPALGPIALAVLRREAEPGAAVRVGEDGIEATVADLPFAEP